MQKFASEGYQITVTVGQPVKGGPLGMSVYAGWFPGNSLWQYDIVVFIHCYRSFCLLYIGVGFLCWVWVYKSTPSPIIVLLRIRVDGVKCVTF